MCRGMSDSSHIIVYRGWPDVTYGWVGKILSVDLSTGEMEHLDTMRYAEKFIGGRGIAAKLAWEHIPHGLDAFDPRNPLMAVTGLLTGTLAPTSGSVVWCSISSCLAGRMGRA